MADISSKLYRIAKLPHEDMVAELMELAQSIEKAERRKKQRRAATQRWRQKASNNHRDDHGDSHSDDHGDVTVMITESACIGNINSLLDNLEHIQHIQAKTPKKASRGQRLPDHWEPSFEDRQFARAAGMDDAQIDQEAASFRDYWHGVPGAKGTKLDWPATWRNRIRSVAARPQRHAKTIRQHNEDLRDRLATLAARFEDPSQVSPQLGSPNLRVVSPDPEDHGRIPRHLGKPLL